MRSKEEVKKENKNNLWRAKQVKDVTDNINLTLSGTFSRFGQAYRTASLEGKYSAHLIVHKPLLEDFKEVVKELGYKVTEALTFGEVSEELEDMIDIYVRWGVKERKKISMLSDVMDIESSEALEIQREYQKIAQQKTKAFKEATENWKESTFQPKYKEVEKFYYANCDAAVDTLDGYALVNNEEVYVQDPNKEKIEKGTILVKSSAIDMPNSGLFISSSAYLAEGELLGRTTPNDKDISFLDETVIQFRRVNSPKGPKIIDGKLYEQEGSLG